MLSGRERAALDRHITGNYGEDQFPDGPEEGPDICGLCGGIFATAADAMACEAQDRAEEEQAEAARARVRREIRGRIYLARLRLHRLEGAWPEPSLRNAHQVAAIRQARRGLAVLYHEARLAKVRPWRGGALGS